MQLRKIPEMEVMIDNSLEKNLRLVLPVICLIILAVIVFAGLRPFQFKPANSVEWLTDPDGLRFSRWGIAYSKDRLMFGEDGLTIELVAESLRESNYSITVLVELYESSNSVWLKVGQWRSSLIIRWSDATSGNRRKYRELGVKDALLPGRRSHILITSGKEGASIYVNGVPGANTPASIPFGSDKGREGYLSLGNFAGRDDQWYGSIYRLALYKARLNSDSALKLYNNNASGDTVEQLIGINASYDYAFDGRGEALLNIRGTGGDISIPKAFNIPEKTILKAPWKEFGLKRSYLKDVVINLFGFIPLGFTFAFFLWKNSGLRVPGISALVVAIGFSTSLTIEILQAFTPSRSSSIGDLLFNTLGTVIGVVLMNSCWRRFWETQRLNKRCEKG